LGSGIASEGYITSEDVAMDFPVINENFTGIINKYGYAQVVDSVATSKTGNVVFITVALWIYVSSFLHVFSFSH